MNTKIPLVALCIGSILLLLFWTTPAHEVQTSSSPQQASVEPHATTYTATSMSPLEPANESSQYLANLINVTALVDFLKASQDPATGGFCSPNASADAISTGNALSTLDLLNATNQIDTALAESYLLMLQKGDGGFSYNDTQPFSDPDSTFFSILGLEALDVLGILDPLMVSNYFLALYNSTFDGFNYFINAPLPDIQSTFDAVLSMAMLGTLHTSINATNVADYVWTLYRGADGSFAFDATRDAGTIDATFFAVMTLKTLGKITAFNLNKTVTYLINHWDKATGGFYPIKGGITTILATYQAVLPLDALGHGSDYPYKLTRDFLVNSQNEDGGFGWFPAGSSDPWGCHFAVFALAHLPKVVGGDVGVLNITLSCLRAGVPAWPDDNGIYTTWGKNITVTVVVKNYGAEPVTFNVTAFYSNATGNYTIGTTTVENLGSGFNETVTFTWAKTIWTNLAIGKYNVSATTTLDGDTNPGNDSLLYGTVTVKLPGDANWSGSVDISDAAIIGMGWGKGPGDPFYDDMGYKADFNWDGVLDISDAAVVGKYWGESTGAY